MDGPAMMSNDGHDDVPAALPHDGGVAVAVAVAAPPRRGGFPAGLRNRRFRNAFYFAACAVAGMVSTTVPTLSANEDHVMLYFLLLVAAMVLLLPSMAGVDLPAWLETAVARLEGFLQDDMF